MKNNKIKLVALALGILTLLGVFSLATPASAAVACDSATFNGTVHVVNVPTWAKFKYSTDYNTVANNGGTPTTVKYYYAPGNVPIEQYVSGLTENTTYHYRLMVSDNTGNYPSNIISFTTPYCQSNPSVTLVANPSTINAGAGSTLSWTSQYATSCSASWTSSTGTSGSQVVYPTSTRTYSITCYREDMAFFDEATVTVNPIQNPTVNLTASPTWIQPGESSALSWTSQYTTYCSASWTSSTGTSGSQIVYPTSTRTYSITCYGNNGTSVTDSAIVNVETMQYPTVTIYANPTNVNSGGSSTITWNSQNATSCSASGGSNGWAGSKNLSGTFNAYSLNSSTTFYITCSNSSGSANDSTTVTVDQVQNPTVTLTANPTSIQRGQHSNLTWTSTNATYCFSYWTNSTATSGNGLVVPTVSTEYRTTCYGSNGSQASDSVMVYVNGNGGGVVNVDLTASPSNIDSGEGSNLSWDSDNADSCSASWTTSTATSGNRMVYPTSTRTYSITCYGDDGQDSDSVTVYVNEEDYDTCRDINATNYGGSLPCRYYQQGQQPTVDIYANPMTTNYNGSTTVTWNSNNATSCTASGASGNWPGYKNTSGSYYARNLTLASRTYTITCSNNYGTATDSVTVYTNRPTYNPGPTVYPTAVVLINSSVDRNQPIIPTIDNTRPCPGDEINYAVNYQNIGTGSITNLALRLDLPYEVDYISSSPSNPNMSGNMLTFNLGTLRANGQGTVTVRVRVRANIPAGAHLNFPAILSYVDPAGNPQSVNTNITAQVCDGIEEDSGKDLGANVLWAGFFPTTIFGWLLLIIFILILALLAKYLFGKSEKKTTTTTH